MAFIIPLEEWCPSVYRMMDAMNIRHFLECNRLRVMLTSICGISVIYCIFCFMSVVSLTCYSCQPWTKEELGDYTRVFRLIESISMALMFWQSWKASFYYIEGDSERLVEKEEQFAELEIKTETAIKLAIQKANRQHDLMHKQLSQKVNRTVRMMRNILKKLNGKKEPKAEQIYKRLSDTMARSLEKLRKPAFEQFKTLINLYGNSPGESRFLVQALRGMQRKSMLVVLVSEHEFNLRRATSGTSDPSASRTFSNLLNEPDEEVENCQELLSSMCSSITWMFSSTGVMPTEGLRLPGKADLDEELKPFTEDEIASTPEKVVLRPVYLVLKWLGKITLTSSDDPARRSTRRITTRHSGAFKLSRILRQFSLAKLREWTENLKRRLQTSAMFRVFLFGLFYSVYLCLFYCNGAWTVAHVIREGKCHGLGVTSCLRAFIQRLIGAIAFAWYVSAVTYVAFHIDIIDQHIQFSKDLAALSQASELVDKLNENELAQEDSSFSLWQKLTHLLSKQEEVVYDFFEALEEKQLKDYEGLALKLKSEGETGWQRARKIVNVMRLVNPGNEQKNDQTDEENQGLLAPGPSAA